MAGNANSGRNATFHLSEKELEEKFEQYRKDLAENKFARASWAHFCFYIGTTEDRLKEFIQEYSEKPESAYYRRAWALRGYLQFFRGELCSSESWNGQQSNKAKLLLGQDHGDGIVYRDKDEKQTGPVEVRISFGGQDKRAKDAAK